MLDGDAKRPGARPTAKLGSGADHTAIIRWLESLEPPAAPAAEPSDAADATATT